MSDDKGKFSTSIGDDVIKAALESVRKRTEGTADPVAAPAAGAEVEVKVETEGAAAPAAAAADEKDKEIASLKEMLEVSQAQSRTTMGRIKDEHEKVLRATADLENYKKRAQKEKEEAQKFGNEKMLKDFLPVLDNFDRALEHATKGGDFASLEKGVAMIRKLFEDALAKHGVKSFESKGKPFDPNFHEAMQHVETDELPPNHVANELIRGFTLNDRLIRPALVMVTRKKPSAPETPADPAAAPAASPEDGGEKKS